MGARVGRNKLRIVGTGHAGMKIETVAGSILCDPWSTPAYFASWFPFPANDGLDWDALGDTDYLYVSHLHHDHFDPALLSRHVRKDATVLLPGFPTDELEEALRALGFTSFVRTTSGVPVALDGLRVAITALTSPTDGPIGDSALAVDDGTACVFDQNDAHPLDIEEVRRFGDIDAHFLQFSGAIWWPMVYDLPDRARQEFARRKRRRQTERTYRYVDAVRARHVFPTAGPPCFLDEDLRHYNDVDGDPTNIFPDQVAFLDQMRADGRTNGRLLLPGTVVEIADGALRVEHPWSDERIRHTFGPGKAAYLEDYARRQQAVLRAERAGRDGEDVDVLAELRSWFEPLLAQADRICAGVGGAVRLELPGEAGVVVDFGARQVRPDDGESARYWFRVDPSLVRACIARRDTDWVNGLFLSLRFAAGRVGPYNEYVYTFFKCLTEERINYAEGWYAAREASGEEIVLDGWRVQRRCPHLMADLSRFGEVDGGVLTCQMHGWQFDLGTGRCLTADGYSVRASPVAGGDVLWRAS